LSFPLESFEPKLEALPAAQQDLWAELQHVPSGLVLYGGTALALRLAHRTSVDFDLFSSDPLDRRGLERLSFMKNAQVLQDEPDALTVSVDRGEPVKVSFFGPVGFGRVGTPQLAGRLPVASLLDLAATKIKVLLQRVEAKDYLDIAAVLRAGLPLEDVLRGARTLFGDAFNPLIAQKTLSWFQGGDLDGVDPASREVLSRAALQDVDLPPMALRSERLDR
jgi:hypothetical protein